MKHTQQRDILEALCKRWLSPLDALERYGCLRLAARVWDLRQAGWPITGRRYKTRTGKTVMQYRLENDWVGRV